MFTYVHYENEKQKGIPKMRDICLNERIDRQPETYWHKKRPPPPPPPSAQRLESLSPRDTLPTVRKCLPSDQTATLKLNGPPKRDSFERFRLPSVLSIDFLNQEGEPMPRCSTPNLNTCYDCRNYTSHCECAEGTNGGHRGYANWKHIFHTSPLTFRAVENIPEALSGNASHKPKIELENVPPQPPVRTTSLTPNRPSNGKRQFAKNRRRYNCDRCNKAVATFETIEPLCVACQQGHNNRQRSQPDYERELLHIRREFEYMKELAVKLYGTHNIETIIMEPATAGPAASALQRPTKHPIGLLPFVR